MPIRPENRARYPKDWAAISRRIRRRARNRCECKGDCGTNHGAEIFISAEKVVSSLRCIALNGKPHPVTGSLVVLTVAHLDQQPENCDPSNLKAMCQRCHNRLDMPHRKRGIAERRRAKLAIKDMFAELPK